MTTIGSLTIGQGCPKICVPLTGRTEEELRHACRAMTDVPYDFIEHRLDFLENAADPAAVLAAIDAVRNELGNTPLLCTFRTPFEGGAAKVTEDYYFDLLQQVIHKARPDAIDIEYSRRTDDVKALLAQANKQGVTVILSYHDFTRTPAAEEIESRLLSMINLGADIAKIACMPQAKADVLTLMKATATVHEVHPDTPLITMSMGKLGVISRLAGEIFGSAVTFGTAGRASAPGQIDACDLKHILSIIHN